MLTENPEIKSVAVIVIAIAEPIFVETGKSIVILLSLLMEANFEDTDQVILVKMPAGLVKIEGSARVRGAFNT